MVVKNLKAIYCLINVCIVRLILLFFMILCFFVVSLVGNNEIQLTYTLEAIIFEKLF